MTAGGKQAALDRAFGHAGRLCDLFYGAVVKVVEHDRHAAFFVERIEGGVQSALLVGPEHGRKRAFSGFPLEKLADGRFTLRLAAVFPRRTAERAEQPRPEFRAVAQRTDRLRTGDKRLLREILAVRLPVMRQASRYASSL